MTASGLPSLEFQKHQPLFCRDLFELHLKHAFIPSDIESS